MSKAWYAVRVQSEREETIRETLDARIRAAGIEEKVDRVLVPSEHLSEVRGGKRRITQQKMFPGYIFVHMDLDDDSWYVITETAGISGFVGERTKPMPMAEEEMAKILRDMEAKKEKPRPKVEFEVGEGVKIKSGPFENYDGLVEGINPEKGTLRVSVSIFGRSTPIYLEYSEVERL